MRITTERAFDEDYLGGGISRPAGNSVPPDVSGNEGQHQSLHPCPRADHFYSSHHSWILKHSPSENSRNCKNPVHLEICGPNCVAWIDAKSLVTMC